MYRVIGRERIYRGRYGKYMVEYSTPWPPEAHRLYLVGNFYSWLPGHLKLKREGKRGRVLLKLWEGEYYYLFCKDCEEYLTDPENEERLKVSLPLAFRGEASVSKVGVKELSKALKEGGLHGEYVIHDERDEAFLSKYLGNLAIRIKVLKGEWDDVSIEYVTREGRNKVSLDKVLSTEFFDYYEAIIPYSSIIRYRFLLSEGGRLYYYGKGGLSDPNYIEPKGIKGLEEKVWYLGTIYYLIFVDSFENGDPNNDIPLLIELLKNILKNG